MTGEVLNWLALAASGAALLFVAVTWLVTWRLDALRRERIRWLEAELERARSESGIKTFAE